jgi:hypothetical protein
LPGGNCDRRRIMARLQSAGIDANVNHIASHRRIFARCEAMIRRRLDPSGAGCRHLICELGPGRRHLHGLLRRRIVAGRVLEIQLCGSYSQYRRSGDDQNKTSASPGTAVCRSDGQWKRTGAQRRSGKITEPGKLHAGRWSARHDCISHAAQGAYAAAPHFERWGRIAFIDNRPRQFLCNKFDFRGLGKSWQWCQYEKRGKYRNYGHHEGGAAGSRCIDLVRNSRTFSRWRTPRECSHGCD